MKRIKSYSGINNKFKVGDIVVCINGVVDEYHPELASLRYGDIFKVFGIKPEIDHDDNRSFIGIYIDGEYVEWYSYRFRLATEDESERYYLENDLKKYNL